MRRLGFLSAIVIFLCTLHAANTGPPPASPALPEIHLLVDVSGSMKKTDPQNLRVKAINMFIYLIKQKALMQIQTFSTTTQTMIPLKPVNAGFQTEYKQKSYQISSNGKWTDIDTAVNKANSAWGLGKKTIILLTDGAVDLGNEFRTTQSKNKLTESTIANLNKNGVRVFTIGFSKNADKALLDNIALKTNGLSQFVNESKDLDNVLYSIFTAIIPVNGAPIKEEKDSSRVINVDKSIHALTLILKKTANINQLFLTYPKGRKKNVEALSNKDVSTMNYLFVEVAEPTPGKWILTGPKQEIERAIILTDVNLISNFVGGSYFQGEMVSLSCHFAQLGEILSSPLIVDNTKVNAQFENEGKNYSFAIPYDKEGIFRTKIAIDQPIGFYRVILTAQNKFISRELQSVIDVYESPLKTSNTDSEYSIKLVRTDLIKEDSASVTLKFDNSSFTLPVQKTDGEWKVDLFPVCSNPSSVKEAHIYFRAKTLTDRPLKLRLNLPDPICIEQEQFKGEIPKIEFATPSLIQKIPKLVKKQAPEKGNLLFTILFYSLIIILALVILVTIWLFWSARKHKKKIDELKEQLQPENIEDEQL